MDEAYYIKYIQPIMYNYISDIRYFKRNAAIAMGNSGNEKYVPDLISVLSNTDEMLREATSWALGSLGTQEALEALVKHQNEENSERVLDTIRLFIS